MLYTGPTHRGDRSGCKKVTLFGSDCYDGLNAVWGSKTHRGDRSRCKKVTLFGSDCDDGLNAV